MYKRTAALIGLFLMGAPLAGCVVVPERHHHHRPYGYYDNRRDWNDRDYRRGDHDGRRDDWRHDRRGRW